MRPVSPQFLTALRGSHRMAARARLITPGQTGTNPGPLKTDGSGQPLYELPIVSGNIQFNTSADVNASLSLETVWPWPETSADLFNPYGTEIFVERSVVYGDGIREWVSLGYFRINSIKQELVPNGPVTVTAEDRMAHVRDAKPTAPNQFTAGTSVGAVLDLVIGDVVLGVTTVYDFSAYTTLLTGDHILDDDRIKFVNELISAYGKVAYFDYQGRFSVKSNPGIATNAPVWRVNSGRYGVMASMSREIGREGVYNSVIASGEPVGEQAPVRAEVRDLVTTSPTYWFGPFGKIPKFFSSSFMTTVDQCTTAATAMLAESTGLPYTVGLGTVPNPALEGWDVITVSYDERRTDETHIIDQITYGLAVGDTMQIQTRKQFLS